MTLRAIALGILVGIVSALTAPSITSDGVKDLYNPSSPTAIQPNEAVFIRFALEG